MHRGALDSLESAEESTGSANPVVFTTAPAYLTPASKFVLLPADILGIISPAAVAVMSFSVLFSPGAIPDVRVRATCPSSDSALAVAIQKAATEMGSSRRLVVVRGDRWQRLDSDALIDIGLADVPAAAPLIILLSVLACMGIGLALLVLAYSAFLLCDRVLALACGTNLDYVYRIPYHLKRNLVFFSLVVR